jgi:hypothetical protein
VTGTFDIVIGEAAAVCLPSDDIRDPIVVEKLAKTNKGAKKYLFHQQIFKLRND